MCFSVPSYALSYRPTHCPVLTYALSYYDPTQAERRREAVRFETLAAHLVSAAQVCTGPNKGGASAYKGGRSAYNGGDAVCNDSAAGYKGGTAEDKGGATAYNGGPDA